jgi:hypothetical protein
MKTFQQFCEEAYRLNEFQLPKVKLPSPGQVVKGGVSYLANPFIGPGMDVAQGATGAVGQKIGGPVGGLIKKAAPVAGIGFGLTRAATPVGVAAATFNQGTAAGRVKVGKDKTGKPIYMDK